MKTALHSVSYAGAWPGQARLSLEDFLRKTRSLGFDGVMLMAKRPHLSVLDIDSDARGKLRQLVKELGLSVTCLAGYTDFCMGADHPEVPTREVQLVYVRELCRLARELDCNLIRVFTGYAHPSLTFDQQWQACVGALRECARLAAPFGVTIGVQNHHDMACHWESMIDLLDEVGESNCKAMFDAWSPALHGSDIVEAARRLAPCTVHTTVADYVRRPRFHYEPQLVNYVRDPDAVRAVPMGEGFIDYRGFLRALREGGYQGAVAYEMCSPLRGGGSEENLDRYARQFIEFMKTLS